MAVRVVPRRAEKSGAWNDSKNTLPSTTQNFRESSPQRLQSVSWKSNVLGLGCSAVFRE